MEILQIFLRENRVGVPDCRFSLFDFQEKTDFSYLGIPGAPKPGDTASVRPEKSVLRADSGRSGFPDIGRNMISLRRVWSLERAACFCFFFLS